MFYDFTWWNLAPIPFFILAMHAALYRTRVGENPFWSKAVSGYMTLAFVTNLIINIAVKHDNGRAVIDAGFIALYGSMWWNSGGGDGIKNFLQSLVMKPVTI